MEKAIQAEMEPTPGTEQIRYAKVLDVGMMVGLLVLLITFVIYVFGILDPYIPLREISRYWRSDVGSYLHDAGVNTGWSWVSMVKYGDFLNFVGIALLAGVTILCYIAIIPIFWKNRDRVYALLAAGEVIVLAVAASGLLGVGGH